MRLHCLRLKLCELLLLRQGLILFGLVIRLTPHAAHAHRDERDGNILAVVLLANRRRVESHGSGRCRYPYRLGHTLAVALNK
jgi:hypothetical protein